MTEPILNTSRTVSAVFYRGSSIVDLCVRAVCRRPGQAFSDVPSHCGLIVPDQNDTLTLYDMTACGWCKRQPNASDLIWTYSVDLPNIKECRVWCENNGGRYRWWVDGVVGLMALKLVRWRRVGPFIQGHLHLAYRHICSLDAGRALLAGKWQAPEWFLQQLQPWSPNDLLFAVREK